MPSPAQVGVILAEVARIRPELAAFFGCLYYAALRPEEAVALRRDDLILPALPLALEVGVLAEPAERLGQFQPRAHRFGVAAHRLGPEPGRFGHRGQRPGVPLPPRPGQVVAARADGGRRAPGHRLRGSLDRMRWRRERRGDAGDAQLDSGLSRRLTTAALAAGRCLTG